MTGTPRSIVRTAMEVVGIALHCWDAGPVRGGASRLSSPEVRRLVRDECDCGLDSVSGRATGKCYVVVWTRCRGGSSVDLRVASPSVFRGLKIAEHTLDV